ncbi:hypothetical protein, partial [Rhodopseudomonas sp. BAL398]|uniref:hypothetical protein n=1 Tax=Rhodopseudomonas sp. BAL398 TaxID=3034676 RepID=UPI0023E30983
RSLGLGGFRLRPSPSLRAEDGASRRPTAKQSRRAERRLDCFVARAPRNDGVAGGDQLLA